MRLIIPEDVSLVMNIFVRNNVEVFLAGEEICNLILGREQHLYNLYTVASHDDVKKFLRKYTEINDELIITCANNTYRIVHVDKLDDINSNCIFSIFSMIYSLQKGLVDKFNAMADIECHIIRCIGEYEKVFAISPVMILRSIVLCAKYGFTLDDGTKREIKRYAVFLRKLRGDVLLPELNEILLSNNPDYIKIMHETMLLRVIMPQLAACFGEKQRNKYHIYDVGDHIMHTVKTVKADKVLRWAALLHDVGKSVTSSVDDNGVIHFYGHHKESKNIADSLLHKFRMDVESISDILILIENHDVRIEPNVITVKKLMSKTGPELFLKLMDLQEADNKAKNPVYFPAKKAKIDAIRRVYYDVIKSNEPYMISHLMITSKDISKQGLKKGKMTSDILRMLLGEVIVNPKLNNRDYLIKKVRQYKNFGG